jgi:hypothetical protein
MARVLSKHKKSVEIAKTSVVIFGVLAFGFVYMMLNLIGGS